MSVLIVKNVATEGPGTIADHLRSANIPFTIVDLEQGSPLPAVHEYSHLIILGGPMAVYEMDAVPYLRDEALFIEKAVKANKHILGVCLGAQLLAHVLGSRVYPGKQKEIGWYDVAITDDGMQDPCMAALAAPGKRTAQVFQWHGDTFDLPSGAVRLASSDLFPSQAFRYADRVYALQFHIEVTPQIVTGWLRNEKGVDFPLIDKRSQEIYGPYRERAEGFYRQFFRDRTAIVGRKFMTIRQHFAVVAFLLCVLPASVFAADAAAPQGTIPDAYSSILQRGVLGGEGSPSSAPQAAPVSSPYRLIGILQSGGFSGVVLDDGTGVQTFYRVDQRLPDDSRIVKVMRDRVLIKLPNGAVSELLVADDTKAPAISSGTKAEPPAASPRPDAAVSDSGNQIDPRPHRRRPSSRDE